MKFKNVLFFVLLNISFLLSACDGHFSGAEETTEETVVLKSNYEEGTAEYTIDCFLKEYKANNIVAMRNYMAGGIISLDENSSAQNEAVKYTWDTITKNFEYKILDCQVKDDEASVKVEMKNIWMSEVMMDTFDEYNTKEISKKADAKQEEIISEFYPILKKYTENYKSKKRFENTVSIDLIKNNGKWEIVNDTAVFDSMTGEYISFISRNLKNYAVTENENENVTQNADDAGVINMK